MRSGISITSRLIRAMASLGVLVCLICGGSVWGQVEEGFSTISIPVGSELSVLHVVDAANLNHAVLTTRVEVRAQDEFEFAIENDSSVEICRAGAAQRTFALDGVVARPRNALKGAFETRPNISSPLLE